MAKLQIIFMNILLLIVLLGLGLYIVAMSYPFYTMELPLKVANHEKQPYSPGEYVQISTHRKSRINTEVDAFRELVRVGDGGSEYEIEKVRYAVGFDKGEKDVALFYQLPNNCELLKSGDYKYTGMATYKVFGIVERTIPFHTELFKVAGCEPDDEANDENNDNQIGPAKVAE